MRETERNCKKSGSKKKDQAVKKVSGGSKSVSKSNAH